MLHWMQENSKFKEFALLVSFTGSTAGLDLRTLAAKEWRPPMRPAGNFYQNP